MAALALALLVLYASLAFGARALVQFRRTGSTGFRGISGRPGSPGWLGGVLFAAAVGLILAAPVLTLTGLLEPFAAVVGFLSLVAAVELQVRFVEEPYLLCTHGEGYAGYASRVGRFVPGVGCLKVTRVRQDA